MARARLFEQARETRTLSRCTDLVPRSTDHCVTCGGATTEMRVGEQALFRHGGYGATRTTAFRLCQNDACRAVRVAYTVETNPRR